MAVCEVVARPRSGVWSGGIREDIIGGDLGRPRRGECSRHRSPWVGVSALFESNLRHPSLHVELLEPRWRGIYSFRLDRKFRALFFITLDGEAEVFQITNHYR